MLMALVSAAQKIDSAAVIRAADSTHVKMNHGVGNVKSTIQKKQRYLENIVVSDTTKHNKNQADVARQRQVSDIKKTQQEAQHKLDSINRLNQQDTSLLDRSKMKLNALQDRLSIPSLKNNHKTSSTDSIGNAINQKEKAVLSKADSVEGKIDKLETSITSKETAYTDSLQELAQRFEQKVQINKLKTKIDSLKNAGMAYEKYTGKLDSLQKYNPQHKLQQNLSSAESKMQKVTGETGSVVNEKLKLLSTESNGQGNVPGAVNIPGVKTGNIPGISQSNSKLPGVNPNLPDVPSVKEPAVGSLNSQSLPNMKTDIGKPANLDAAAELKKVDAVTKETKELNQYSQKASEYTKDIKNIESVDQSKMASMEDKVVKDVTSTGELSELQKQDKLLKEQQAKLESFKHPEEYKKQTLERSKKMVAQQMALYEKQLQQSVSKISKYQTKAGTILSQTGDLPKKRDPLKRLKTWEKFVPGLTLQIQKPGAWLVDFNPSLRYRLTSYWSIGTGWNERAVFGNYVVPYSEARIFGARAFTEVIIFKGFSMRLDAEDMNAFVPLHLQQQDAGKRIWVWSYMAGLKKDFSFVRRVTGNVQFMYNLYTSSNYSPYPTRLNVRFGFEPVLKKRIKK